VTDSASETGKHRSKRRVFVPLVWTAGAVAAVLLGLTVSGTLSGFTAAITNDTNTTGSGTLLMQETNSVGPVNCYSNGGSGSAAITTNTNTCSTINKLGGDQSPNTAGLNLTPGAAGTVTVVTIKNAGSIAASLFTLTPSTCAQSTNTGNTVVSAVGAYGSASDFCTKVNVTIKKGATTVFQGTAAQLSSGTGAATPLVANLGPVSAGGSAVMEFDVSLDTTAGNSYQGLALSLPMTWQFTQ
jgi:hypothetical protein